MLLKEARHPEALKQFILKSEPDKDGRVRFEGGDYRYLVRVRRYAPGECFPALLPGGAGVVVRVLSVDNHALVGEVVQAGHTRREVSVVGKLPPIILFQALPKGEKMDTIVRQAAEGGLTEIVPFASEFSAVQINAGKGGIGGQKFSRWERIIKEARQQSGSAIATTIRQPVPFDGLLAYWEQIRTQTSGTCGLLFHHLPLENVSLHEYLGSSGKSCAVVLAIGPEGGFSPVEVERFLAAGFKPFTIGDTILRTETAALYAAAAVRVLLLERDSWETNEDRIRSENG